MIIEKNMPIQHSKTEHLAEYANHLKQLSDQDRYTRFGYAARPENVDRLILDILYNPNKHHIFTYYQDDHVVGFGHLAKEGKDWELAVSVEEEYQGMGIADALMSHMIAWGKTHGVLVLYMHCIVDNRKIQHLARKHGLRAVDRSSSDITARVELPKPTVLDYTSSLVQEQNELATDIVKLQRSWIRKWFQPLSQ
jgi:GNAT superfamily N-acetyltransferase